VDADDHVDDELQDAEDVWVVGARVGAIKELQHAPHTKHSVDAHERKVNAKQQVEQVGGQEADDVNRELPGVHVVATQLLNVRDDEALFQVRFTPHSLSRQQFDALQDIANKTLIHIIHVAYLCLYAMSVQQI